VRQAMGWDVRALTEADTLAMPEIDVALKLADIYGDVELPPLPEDDGR